MLKAIIFDFDGVIADTELERFTYIKKQLKNYGYKLKNKDMSKIIGMRTFQAIIRLCPEISKEYAEKIADERKKHIEDQITKVKPLPYIKPFVKYLNRKYTLAITSGAHNKKMKLFLKHYDMDKYFNLIVGGDDYSASNPHPKDYRITLQKLKLKPSEAIIIEDSQAGIEAARITDCKIFGLENKYDISHVKDADKIFKDYKSMLKYFKSFKELNK